REGFLTPAGQAPSGKNAVLSWSGIAQAAVGTLGGSEVEAESAPQNHPMNVCPEDLSSAFA
ncbi:MAG TPA: hypothetical protein VJQ82_14970, partial [Terriglobales bacterium]|nr:hypothetical protein [Terriglobales bacterium]